MFWLRGQGYEVSSRGVMKTPQSWPMRNKAIGYKARPEHLELGGSRESGSFRKELTANLASILCNQFAEMGNLVPRKRRRERCPLPLGRVRETDRWLVGTRSPAQREAGPRWARSWARPPSRTLVMIYDRYVGRRRESLNGLASPRGGDVGDASGAGRPSPRVAARL